KPLKCLFVNEMQNTRIQRWAVLLAEYGAKIEYRQGRHNIRADMLSRIPDAKELAIFDVCEEYVEIENENAPCTPSDLFDLDNDMVQKAQVLEFPKDFEMSREEGNGPFITHNNMLYSICKPAEYLSSYPRLMMPSAFRKQVLTSVHKKTGHAGLVKLLHELFDVCVWPGMRQDAKFFLKKCALCQINNSQPERCPMGEMPIAKAPGD
ncbi:MAG: hypothetical protein GY702_27815, partial [Desulfobulbaceae bacterium]|nr:hypothetical protein [Desulfobulbaceae bacterium]